MTHQNPFSSATVLALFSVCSLSSGLLAAAQDRPAADAIVVSDFLPAGYVRDGSVSYQAELQAALDAAAGTGRQIVFPPMTYLLNSAAGLRVASDMTLWMHGARFVLSPKIREDGQAFRGQAVRNLRFFGGEIIGRNDQWPLGTNVRGIYLTGECRHVRIADMVIRDSSSNGVGVFGADADHTAGDVWLLDTVIDHCCNVYGDYQAPAGELRGPEKGSVREDQGSVAFYFVGDFVVRGCRFEDSRSEGTHFYRCRNGHFTDNRVYRAKMGGY
ncbi:MAG: hypothetical protein HY000_03410, partial [Planctomycetes bacterium]|nr:hypothetical protein [Planctomycetota bacterium]